LEELSTARKNALSVLELEKKMGMLEWVLIGGLCIVVAAVVVGFAAYLLAKRTNK